MMIKNRLRKSLEVTSVAKIDFFYANRIQITIGIATGFSR